MPEKCTISRTEYFGAIVFSSILYPPKGWVLTSCMFDCPGSAVRLNLHLLMRTKCALPLCTSIGKNFASTGIYNGVRLTNDTSTQFHVVDCRHWPFFCGHKSRCHHIWFFAEEIRILDPTLGADDIDKTATLLGLRHSTNTATFCFCGQCVTWLKHFQDEHWKLDLMR